MVYINTWGRVSDQKVLSVNKVVSSTLEIEWVDKSDENELWVNMVVYMNTWGRVSDQKVIKRAVSEQSGFINTRGRVSGKKWAVKKKVITSCQCSQRFSSILEQRWWKTLAPKHHLHCVCGELISHYFPLI